MLSQIPARAWLLLAIAAVALVPARYVFERLTGAYAGRKAAPPLDGSGVSARAPFARSVAMLGALAAVAVFIFTPAASQLAQAPSFWPVLIMAFGAYAIFTVAKGLSTGRIQPLIRGFNYTCDRTTQTRRFWASMTWNMLTGCFCLWIGWQTTRDASLQATEQRCYDEKNVQQPKDQLAACNELLARRGSDKPTIANLLIGRGSAYFRLGDYRHASDDYTEASRLAPDSSIAQFDLGLADAQLGYPALAIDDFSAAVHIDPNDPDAYFERGRTFFTLGKLDRAIADFTKAHDLKPDEIASIANRGIAYAWQGDRDRADRDFRMVRRVEPSNPIPLRGEAILALMAGNPGLAVARLTEALKSDPTEQWSLAMRAEAYRQLGDREKMQADIAEVKRLRTTSSSTGR